MTVGEKIKFLRTRQSITQEALAEKLNVSRSAIAKWETNNGTPDISNLKIISQMFAISIDELLDDAQQMDERTSKDTTSDGDCLEYKGHYYDIELKGWNDGVYDVLIIGEDQDFLFYQKKVKENSLYGLIGKRYVTSVNKKSECSAWTECPEFVGRNYFCGKHVFLELAAKEGVIKGFFDFRNDDYRDVVIQAFTDTMVSLKLGGEISIDTITKIEELPV